MDPSPLKHRLQQCSEKPLLKTDFSIGHRGAALQFPEHTKESYEAAARMGAGIVECDVTFTKDKQLVRRHAQNDLHTTTNILATSRAEMHQGFHLGRVQCRRLAENTGVGRVSHQRHYPGRVQDPQGEDGCL
jgi:glycerophosphoryl diester phosphodiesterase